MKGLSSHVGGWAATFREDDDRKGAASANDLVDSVLKVSVRLNPRHPHLLVEWPARARKLCDSGWLSVDATRSLYFSFRWRLRRWMGRWRKYQRNKTKSIQTDKAKQDRRKQGDERALSFKSKSRRLRGSGQQKASATRNNSNQISGCLEFRGSSCRFGQAQKGGQTADTPQKCLRTQSGVAPGC